MDNPRTYLINMPTNVPGMLTVDDNGEPIIYLNARLTETQHRRAYEHELRHFHNDDLFNGDNIEIVETRASGITPQIDVPKQPQTVQKPKKPIAYLELSDIIQEEAQERFGLSTTDKRWSEIWWAMLITGLPDQPGRPSRIDKKRIYYYPPVKIKAGRMYKAPKRLPYINRLEQRDALMMPSYFRLEVTNDK